MGGVNVGEILHCHRPLASRLLARIQSFAVLHSLVWLGAAEPTAVAEDRSASRAATAPDDLHNEDPRSHFTTSTGERCPCAMRLRATAAIAATYPYSGCRITVSRSAASMYDRRRWLWRLLSCRMQDIFRLLCLDGTTSRSRHVLQHGQHSRDARWQADQPQPATATPLPASSRSADGSG